MKTRWYSFEFKKAAVERARTAHSIPSLHDQHEPPRQARVVFHPLIAREPYDDTVFAKAEQKYRQRTEARLKAQALAFGYVLTPVAEQQ